MPKWNPCRWCPPNEAFGYRPAELSNERMDRIFLVGVTGPLSDRWGRKGLIVTGMWIQAGGLLLVAVTQHFGWWLIASVLLGVGTAMVYPTLIASVSDASHPSWRARSLSVYRFWRDMGYALGALGARIMTDMFGAAWAIAVIGALTFTSGAVVAVAMKEGI
jgi:MFS family permease